MVIIHCKNCGEIIKSRYSKRKFCSRKCVFEYRTGKTYEEIGYKTDTIKNMKKDLIKRNKSKKMKDIVSKSHKGMKFSEESKERMRQSQMGNQNNPNIRNYPLSCKGKTNIEIYGKERAEEIRIKQISAQRISRRKYCKEHNQPSDKVHTVLTTYENGKVVRYIGIIKRKRPIDSRCEVCEVIDKTKYLAYHHWGKIEKSPKVTCGIWTCRRCHRIIEYWSQEKYLIAFLKYLKRKEEIERELGDN